MHKLRNAGWSLILLLFGCTKYGEVVDRVPYKTMPMNMAPNTAADCFHAHLIRTIGSGITLVRVQDKDGPHVAGQIAGAGSGDFYLFDVSFAATGHDASTAVIRTKMDVWGKPQMPDEALAALRACGEAR